MLQRVYSSTRITLKKKEQFLKKIDADSFIRMCCEVSIPTYENKKKCFNKFFDMKDLNGLGPD